MCYQPAFLDLMKATQGIWNMTYLQFRNVNGDFSQTLEQAKGTQQESQTLQSPNTIVHQHNCTESFPMISRPAELLLLWVAFDSSLGTSFSALCCNGACFHACQEHGNSVSSVCVYCKMSLIYSPDCHNKCFIPGLCIRRCPSEWCSIGCSKCTQIETFACLLEAHVSISSALPCDDEFSLKA